MNHVMLDIETFGQGSNSVIVSIGAVQFDIETGKTGLSFHMYIDPESCIEAGLKIEPGTILWWLNQSDIARTSLLKSIKNSSSLATVLTCLGEWFDAWFDEEPYVWGRGPRFDFGLLTDAYKSIGLPIPWNSRKELCVRTMEFLRPGIKDLTEIVDTVGHGSEGGGEHNAHKDCRYQIKYVSNIFKNLNFSQDWKNVVQTILENETEKCLLRDIPGNNF